MLLEVKKNVWSFYHTLELRLLDEAAVVLIEDLEDIFDFLG